MVASSFTLIEVLLALSILVFAVVAVLGVISVVVEWSRDNWMETRSAHIAQQIVADLGSGTNQFGYLIQGTNFDSPDSRKTLDLTTTNDATSSYDVEGQPLAAADPGARFRAAIHIAPESSLVSSNGPGGTPDPFTMSRVEVSVNPVAMGTNAFLFVTKLVLPGVPAAAAPTP